MALNRLYSTVGRPCIRQFGLMCRLSSAIDGKFEEAKIKLNALKNDPGNETKLKMYALFKQATSGKNTSAKPGAFNFVGQAKWTAWNNLGAMTQDEAKQAYVDLVGELAKSETGDDAVNASSGQQETETGAKIYGSEGLIVNTENQVTTITLNRPNRLNALTYDMYEHIATTLNDVAKDDTTSLVVLTGTGEFFCSGNDLKNFENVSPSNMKQVAIESADLLRRFVASFIDFPKPIIVAINGPAIGIPVTILGLCDVVYASDHATFETPFSKIGQSPEACSTYTFPKIMGISKACSMMLFNNKINADEAEKCGLVSKVFPQSSFQEDVQNEVKEMMKLPLKSLLYSKQLIRDCDRDTLHKVNIAECERLIERWTSEDCINAVMAFLTRR